MANPIKATTHPTSPPDAETTNKTWNKPVSNKMLEDQEKVQTRSTIIYAILAMAVLVGGYYFYATEWPSAAVTQTITKTDNAPTANAPAASTPAVPAAPSAESTTAVPAAPAAGTAPAPATTTTP